ncbi:MAG: LysE family translocator [bacterium]
MPDIILNDFLTVIIAHGLAVASPGPDFSIVMRESLRCGKKPAIWAAIGIGSGISVHVLYSLLGITLLIKNTPGLFQALRWIGAAYLLYLAWGSFTSSTKEAKADMQGELHRTNWHAWRLGFLTNVLNPKASLFFLALFSVLLSPQTTQGAKIIYGAWMTLATMGWFTLVAIFFSRQKVREAYLRKSWLIDRIMGVILVLLAIRLALP